MASLTPLSPAESMIRKEASALLSGVSSPPARPRTASPPDARDYVSKTRTRPLPAVPRRADGKPPRLPPRTNKFREPSPDPVDATVQCGGLETVPSSESAEDNGARPYLAASHSATCDVRSSRVALSDDVERDGGYVSEEACLGLARLMLSPGGLSARKVTLEGFAIPATLRLLEREPAARTTSPSLALTWLDDDDRGFEVSALTAIVSLDATHSDMWSDLSELPRSRASSCSSFAVGRNEHVEHTRHRRDRLWSRGDASKLLMLCWADYGAEVVVEVRCEQERDVLKRCLEMLVQELGATFADRAPSAVSLEDVPRAIPVVGEGAAMRAAVAVAAAGTGSSGMTAGAAAGTVCSADEREDRAHTLAAWDHQLERRRSSIAFWSLQERHARSTSSPSVVSGAAETFPGLRRTASSNTAPSGWGAACRHGDSGRGGLEAEELRGRIGNVMGKVLVAYDRSRDEWRAAASRVAAVKLRRLVVLAAARKTQRCWARWCGAVRKANEERQRVDRLRWYLHAKANEENDLLAWYHSTFCREVYRRRVPFWYRETRLQPYQKEYCIVDDVYASYTPMERSIMTSCVCTVGTLYPDVAAQLFTARDLLTAEEYRLFQRLVKQGAEVPKAAAKSGRRAPYPVKMRIWFDRGALCLTAKREKPDRTQSTDHSFYLSKVRICLLAPPAGRAAGGWRAANPSSTAPSPVVAASAAREAGTAGDDHLARLKGHGSPSLYLATASSWPGPEAPSGAEPGGAGVDLSRRLARGGAAVLDGERLVLVPRPSNGSMDGITNAQLYREEPQELAGAGDFRSGSSSSSGGTGGCGGENRFPKSAARRENDGRDRGAGGGASAGSSAAWEECSNASSDVLGSPASSKARISSRRVLSIFLFGRYSSLDLWFAGEAEGAAWQGMLTKLAWKEQGYLYREAAAESATDPLDEDAGDDHHEDTGDGPGGGQKVPEETVATPPSVGPRGRSGTLAAVRSAGVAETEGAHDARRRDREEGGRRGSSVSGARGGSVSPSASLSSASTQSCSPPERVL